MIDDGYVEKIVTFECVGERLVGVIASAVERNGPVGALVVVGGPQYRVGSHRQFVHLSRSLARSGITSMRFDYRGMGDASGSRRDFEEVGEDIRAAIDAFFAQCPWLDRLVIWGLCDGASASCFYAPQDRRIAGVAIANPWVRSEASYAKTQLRHYYGARLVDPALWRRVGKLDLDIKESAKSLLRTFGRLAARTDADASAQAALPERMGQALARFGGEILVLISGRDLTAREFCDVSEKSPVWREVLSRARIVRHEDADHTMSTASARAWAERATAEWVRDRVECLR